MVVDESGSEVRSHHLLRFELPPPLSTYALYMPGANLIEETYVAIYWDGRNTYTLHIPFTVGDARWVHHMEFEIEAKRRLVIGAPGMPELARRPVSNGD